MARGRPRNETKHLPLLVQRDLALAKHAKGEPLTLDETALAIWNPKTEKKPLTVMGIQKIEIRAMAKLKAELKRRYGITGIDDMFESKHGYATKCENQISADV